MEFEQLKSIIEETNPDIDDDTVNNLLEVVNKKEPYPQTGDKLGTIAQLESEMLDEPDWKKRAIKAAKLINMKHFDYLDT